MCFSNALQRSRFGRYQRYRQTRPSSPLALSLQTWTIYFGESFRKWMIISSHGYYGIFGNLNMDLRETLKLVETESIIWGEAQILNTQRATPTVAAATLPSIPGRWCFTDGSWKENDCFSGQGWYITLEGFDSLMGARNVQASLSPLHAEVEALVWAMECMRNLRQTCVTFATDCSQLVKRVSKLEEWPAFTSYLEDIKSLKENFFSSESIHVPRTENIKADSLARSVRIQSAFVVHMDAEPPAWFSEIVWVCLSWWQKKWNKQKIKEKTHKINKNQKNK